MLVLRNCPPDMKTKCPVNADPPKRFQWPTRGPVKAPDFKKTRSCGHGLHGWAWGVGNTSLGYGKSARWLVVDVPDKTVIDLGGKVKFPRGKVVFCGSRAKATDYILKHGGAGRPVMYARVKVGEAQTAIVGDHGSATAGRGGLAWAGNFGTAKAGAYGMAVAGDGGRATAGIFGFAKAGCGGKVAAGAGGTICAAHYSGEVFTAAVGINGILPDVLYWLRLGAFVPA